MTGSSVASATARKCSMMPRCGGLLYIGETCSRWVAPAERISFDIATARRVSFDPARVLVDRHGRGLAGRAAGHQEVHALSALPVDERGERRLVDRPAVVER